MDGASLHGWRQHAGEWRIEAVSNPPAAGRLTAPLGVGPSLLPAAGGHSWQRAGGSDLSRSVASALTLCGRLQQRPDAA